MQARPVAGSTSTSIRILALSLSQSRIPKFVEQSSTTSHIPFPPAKRFPRGFLSQEGPRLVFLPSTQSRAISRNQKISRNRAEHRVTFSAKFCSPSLVDHNRHCGWDCFEFIKCLLQKCSTTFLKTLLLPVHVVPPAKWKRIPFHSSWHCTLSRTTPPTSSGT